MTNWHKHARLLETPEYVMNPFSDIGNQSDQVEIAGTTKYIETNTVFPKELDMAVYAT